MRTLAASCARSHMWRAAVGLPLVGLLLASFGCRGADRGAYLTLADVGTQVTTGTRASIQLSRESLEKLVEARHLGEAFTNRPLASPGAVAEMGELAKQLSARADALTQLSRTYAALNSLAAYDAAAEVEGALNGLTGAVNEYAKSVNSGKPALSNVAGGIISKIGAGIAGEVQRGKLRTSSELTRERVSRFRELLQRERAAHAAAAERISEETVRVTSALWKGGFGDPSGIIRYHLVDLSPAAESKQIIDRVTKMREAAEKPGAAAADVDAWDKVESSVASVLKWRAGRRLELTISIIDENIAAFDDLIAQHVRLEGDQPITLESLTAHISMIRTFADELQRLRALDAAAGPKA